MALSKERIKKLESVIQTLTRESIILITQLDPDAIACAVLFKHICEQLKSDSQIPRIVILKGSSHPQNSAIMNKYDLSSTFLFLNDVNSYDKVVLVDSSSRYDDRLSAEYKPLQNVVVVIDHHQGDIDPFTEDENNFFHVEKIGAASTLMVEIAQLLEIDITPFAALLTIGIFTDTAHLQHVTERDRQAHAYASARTIPGETEQLLSYKLPSRFFENLLFALQNRVKKDDRVVAYIGVLEQKDADDVSTFAELFKQEAGVELVLTWCLLKEENRIRISARCSDLSIDLAAFLRERFDSGGAKLVGGMSAGGAHFDIGIDKWHMPETEVELIELLKKAITEKTFLP